MDQRAVHIWSARWFRFGAVLTVVAVCLGFARGGTMAAQTPSAEEELAEKYAPVLYIAIQNKPCDAKGDAYFPAPVEMVLGNPRITLVDEDGDERTETTGPTAADVFRLDRSDYLRYQGNPRRPGCTYDREFRALLPLPAVTYAHVATEEGEPGLALQYWFFYYFNDADNTHEGDWEMIQLAWDVGTAAEALQRDPVSVAYAQHNGGETADWVDDKVRKEDGHPVVFVADGSHASHYDDDVFLGYGEDGAGLGCDDAAGPNRRVPLTPILVPTTVEDQDSPLAWLTFEGLWGKKERSMWSGPTGPNTKPKWEEPFTWVDGLRSSSINVGENNPGGLSAINVFCTVVSWGGTAVNLDATSPLAFRALVVVALLLLGWFVWIARGTLGAAGRIYLRHFRIFALIGLALIPAGLVLNLVQWAISCQAAGSPTGAVRAYRAAVARLRVVAGALVPAWLKVVALVLSVVGLPWAIGRAVRWAFVSPAAVLDEAATSREAIALSAGASRGRWWRTFVTLLLLVLIGAIAAPVLGMVVMVGLHWPLGWVTTLSGLLATAMVPYAFVGATVLYRELRTAEAVGVGLPVGGD